MSAEPLAAAAIGPLAAQLEAIIMAGVAITTRALSQAGPDLDLTFPQWRVLLVLGEREEGMILTELAHRIGVTLPATSRQVHRLAARGLLEVRRDEHDRRAARVRLSADGASVREGILAYRRQRIADIARSIRVAPETVVELAAIAEAFKYHR